jgi:hypothetical protein
MASAKTSRLTGAFICAVALALQAQAAHAQQQCFSQDEVSAAFVYAMPGVIEGVTTRCSASLGTNGFLARQGKAMAARYTAQQNAAWPKARSALLKIVTNASKTGNSNGTLGVLSQIPADTMRPLIDALIVQEAANRTETAQCGKVDKLAAAIAPLDPRDAGNLLGTMFAVFEPNHPLVCVAQNKSVGP